MILPVRDRTVSRIGSNHGQILSGTAVPYGPRRCGLKLGPNRYCKEYVKYVRRDAYSKMWECPVHGYRRI